MPSSCRTPGSTPDLRHHQRRDLSRGLLGRLCEVFEDVRKSGGRTPQIAFMVNTRAGQTAERIYNDLYKPGRFRDLWFTWQGKPLLICDPKEAGREGPRRSSRSAAPTGRSRWSTPPTPGTGRPPIPQSTATRRIPRRPEQVNVSVAQNLRVGDGQVTNMSAGNARGRSFHDGSLDRSPGAVDRGAELPGAVEAGLRSSTRRS